jgi:hypothetical protein
MAIAGHVTRRMLEHYSHIRTKAKRDALDSISTRLPEPEGEKIPVLEGVVHQIGNQTGMPENAGVGKLLN